MARDLGATKILAAVLSLVRAARATTLSPVGLKLVDQGEWQVPTTQSQADMLPAVVGAYAGFQPEPGADRPADAVIGTHLINLMYLRALGDTELKNVAVLQDAELIANLFIQGRFPLSVDESTGIRVRRCYLVEFEPGAGFLLDEVSEIEEFRLLVAVETTSYNV